MVNQSDGDNNRNSSADANEKAIVGEGPLAEATNSAAAKEGAATDAIISDAEKQGLDDRDGIDGIMSNECSPATVVAVPTSAVRYRPSRQKVPPC